MRNDRDLATALVAIPDRHDERRAVLPVNTNDANVHPLKEGFSFVIRHPCHCTIMASRYRLSVTDPITPRRFLAIAAHPDDLDFGCAGTTATLTAEGHEVVYCIVTNGQAGGDDPTVSRDDMAKLRQAEQTAAATVVGVSTIHWLNFPDGAVEANLDLRREISRVIRVVKPDVVITQSPTRNLNRIYTGHPDHLATGEATLCAVYPDSRNMFAFPELLDGGFEPHTVPEIWIMSGPDIDHYIDITDKIDAKVEALLCHVSQIPDPPRMRKLMPEWAGEVAEKGGLPAGRMAEGFRKVNTA